MGGGTGAAIIILGMVILVGLYYGGKFVGMWGDSGGSTTGTGGGTGYVPDPQDYGNCTLPDGSVAAGMTLQDCREHYGDTWENPDHPGEKFNPSTGTRKP